MKIFQEKRRAYRFIFSKPMLLLFASAALFLFGAALNMSYRAFEANKSNTAVEIERKRLEAEKADLESKIERLDRPEWIEKEAKERFNVKKPGEEVLVIVDSNPVATKTPNSGPGQTFWNFLKNLFK